MKDIKTRAQAVLTAAETWRRNAAADSDAYDARAMAEAGKAIQEDAPGVIRELLALVAPAEAARTDLDAAPVMWIVETDGEEMTDQDGDPVDMLWVATEANARAAASLYRTGRVVPLYRGPTPTPTRAIAAPGLDLAARVPYDCEDAINAVGAALGCNPGEDVVDAADRITAEAKIGRALLAMARLAHPLPWTVDDDWTHDVIAADGTTLAKCLTHDDAQAIVDAAIDAQKRADLFATEMEKMLDDGAQP